MPFFAVWRSQDVDVPLAVLDAPEAAAAIQTIKGLDTLGELVVRGYWGSEDENGYKAEPATEQQTADYRPERVERAPDAAIDVMWMAKPDF